MHFRSPATQRGWSAAEIAEWKKVMTKKTARKALKIYLRKTLMADVALEKTQTIATTPNNVDVRFGNIFQTFRFQTEDRLFHIRSTIAVFIPIVPTAMREQNTAIIAPLSQFGYNCGHAKLFASVHVRQADDNSKS